LCHGAACIADQGPRVKPAWLSTASRLSEEKGEEA
jgi:hypothetical protein